MQNDNPAKAPVALPSETSRVSRLLELLDVPLSDKHIADALRRVRERAAGSMATAR